VVVFEPTARENLLQEHLVAVAFINMDVRTTTSELAKLFGFTAIEVDAMNSWKGGSI
jgi:hypothetical protein